MRSKRPKRSARSDEVTIVIHDRRSGLPEAGEIGPSSAAAERPQWVYQVGTANALLEDFQGGWREALSPSGERRARMGILARDINTLLVASEVRKKLPRSLGAVVIGQSR